MSTPIFSDSLEIICPRKYDIVQWIFIGQNSTTCSNFAFVIFSNLYNGTKNTLYNMHPSQLSQYPPLGPRLAGSVLCPGWYVFDIPWGGDNHFSIILNIRWFSGFFFWPTIFSYRWYFKSMIYFPKVSSWIFMVKK